MVVRGSALLARKTSPETGLQAGFAECFLPVFAVGVSRQGQVRVLDSWWQLARHTGLFGPWHHSQHKALLLGSC